ncbi:MAG: hypothetical protein K0Q99_1228 [Clostridia bacterium]|jgi:hypothetical protein|nr:hypothetical protein [Clostridia bacterium]
MISLFSSNSICLIGKIRDVEKQLASIKNMNITLAEYIKQQCIIQKNSLN